MLKKFNSRQSERGVVYVTVVMIILVLTVLALSVVSLNINQSILAEREVLKIQAEALAIADLHAQPQLEKDFLNDASKANEAKEYADKIPLEENGPVFVSKRTFNPRGSGINGTRLTTYEIGLSDKTSGASGYIPRPF